MSSDELQFGAMDVRGIIRRAKEAMGVSTDGELASHLGVPRATVASWKRRGSIPASGLAEIASGGISLDWLVYGTGDPDDRGEFGVDAEFNELPDYTLDQEVLWIVLNILRQEYLFSSDEGEQRIADLLDKKTLSLIDVHLHKYYPMVEKSKKTWMKAGIIPEEKIYQALLVEYGLLEFDSDFVLPPWWKDPGIV